jgi:hypothetical protein
MSKWIAANPLTLVFVLADDRHKIKGFVWATINPLADSLDISAVSLNKKYQKAFGIKALVYPFLNEIKTQLGLTSFRWWTKRREAFMRMGYNATGWELMEYKDDKERGV